MILLAGITYWQASAQSQDALQPQSQNVEGTVNPGFVAAWQDDSNSNKVYNILARGFNSDRSQRFADFRVNPDTSGQQLKPDVAMGAFGDFAVVYEDDRDGNEFYDLFARGFDSKGKQSALFLPYVQKGIDFLN